MDYYVTGIAMSQFAYGAERLGLPSKKVLQDLGMDPAEVLQPMAHIPLLSYERFVLELVLISGDELFGYRVGSQVMPALYGVLPSLAFSAMNLRQAIEVCCRYQSLAAGNVGELVMAESGDSLLLTWSMVHQNPVMRRHMVECTLALVGNMFRFVCGDPDLAPRSLKVEHLPSSQEAAKELAKFARCQIEYGALSTVLELGQDMLRLTLNAHGDESLRLAEELAREQLQRQQQSDEWLSRIRLQVRDLMQGGSPRRELVADRLGISVRTLDRRLADEGISWQQLLDGMRAQLAREYLLEPDSTVQSIAHRLGFSDLRAFQRRFRVWTGMTPSEYRDQRS